MSKKSAKKPPQAPAKADPQQRAAFLAQEDAVYDALMAGDNEKARDLAASLPAYTCLAIGPGSAVSPPWKAASWRRPRPMRTNTAASSRMATAIFFWLESASPTGSVPAFCPSWKRL